MRAEEGSAALVWGEAILCRDARVGFKLMLSQSSVSRRAKDRVKACAAVYSLSALPLG